METEIFEKLFESIKAKLYLMQGGEIEKLSAEIIHFPNFH
jgi:hypothetical protein